MRNCSSYAERDEPTKVNYLRALNLNVLVAEGEMERYC